MAEHWKDVREKLGIGGLGWLVIQEARAKDAEAHAAALAAKDAEIARLRAQVDEYAHLRSIVELYRSDPMAMADSLWLMREELGRLRAEKD